MLCDKCGQREATVKFVQIENNQKTELRLCGECAQDHPSFSMGFDLQNILSSLFQQKSVSPKADVPKDDRQCSLCQSSLKDIQKSGRLGCGNCYDVFKNELDIVLRRVHGSTNHTGKVPKRGYPKARKSRKIEEIRKQLAASIQVENYEAAALYRDEIKRLEQELAQEVGEDERTEFLDER